MHVFSGFLTGVESHQRETTGHHSREVTPFHEGRRVVIVRTKSCRSSAPHRLPQKEKCKSPKIQSGSNISHIIPALMAGSSSYSSWITGEELKSFHWIDREIFSRLVIQLGRNVEESMRVIGFWLWLEEMGSSNLIIKLQSTPDYIFNLILKEALNCLNRLETMIRSDQTQSLNEEENINMNFTLGVLNVTGVFSSGFFTEKKVSVLRSVNRFVTDVAPRAFDDIILQTLVHRAQFLGGPVLGPGPSVQSQPIIPGGLSSVSQFVVGGPSSSDSNPMVDLQGTPNDRTLFVTFSRGYPITERELSEFFTRNFGDCLESIYLQQDTEKPYGQALFALVVVRSANHLDLILQGAEDGKVKFVVNGKHARARKYLTKGST